MKILTSMYSCVGAAVALVLIFVGTARAGSVVFEVKTYCKSFPADPGCLPGVDLPYPVAAGGSETYGGFPGTLGFASFQFAQDTFVDTVEVTGWFGCNGSRTCESLNIQFWLPGTGFFFSNVPDTSAPIVSYTPIGVTSQFSGNDPFGTPFDTQIAVLPTPFLAEAGQKYFFSAPGFWEIGFLGSPSSAYQCNASNCGQFAVGRVAFRLDGTVAPEPVTGLLVATGLLPWAIRRRRRFRSRVAQPAQPIVQTGSSVRCGKCTPND